MTVLYFDKKRTNKRFNTNKLRQSELINSACNNYAGIFLPHMNFEGRQLKELKQPLQIAGISVKHAPNRALNYSFRKDRPQQHLAH